MNRKELDRLQKSRLTPVRKAWSDSHELIVPDVFVSQRVVEDLPEDKAILPAFRSNAVLSLLPFVKNLYVLVCPKCVSMDSLDNFSALATSGLIVPIFTQPYARYPESVVSAVAGADHISCHEFYFYRLAFSLSRDPHHLCGHCVKLRHDGISKVASELKFDGIKTRFIDDTITNLHPFSAPDSKFLDELESALKAGQVERLEHLRALSFAIGSARIAKAFNAAQIVRDREILSIPHGAVSESDDSRTSVIRLTELAADGLKIRLPVDLPIHQYIELVQDYRPKILGLTQQLLGGSNSASSSQDSLLEAINSINRDIERVKGSRRYLFVEALAGFVRSNPGLAASALIAGALGLTGSTVGCIGAPLIGVGADLLKKAGRLKAGQLKTNDAAKRLGRKLRRDLQPSIDKLIARYVGSNTTAMHVLSIREDLISTEKANRSISRVSPRAIRKRPLKRPGRLSAPVPSTDQKDY